MPRTVTTSAICIAAATMLYLQTTTRSAAGPPNILFILADDLGYETLGCYGGTSYRTPHLDQLAAGGMRFNHCYSMPVCHPTRVCLLTGRYPFRMNHPRWGSFPASAEKQTFAASLKRAGYATAIAGKWQLALLKRDPEHPHRLGFDDYCLFGWHEGPRYYAPLIWQNGKVRDDIADRYGPDVYTEFLIDFMRRHRDQPFLAFYSMALCHDVTDDLKKPVPFAPGKEHYDSYQEMVQAMDARVGRLLAALERLKLREKTLVMFTGDNGTPGRSIARVQDGKLVREPISSRLGDVVIRGGKGQLSDAGTRVPLIANWPGTIASEQVVGDLIDFSDFFATFLDLAGADLPADRSIDGRSFAPRLRGKDNAARSWAFSEHKNEFWVRNQRWKLYSDGRLYDVAKDVLEKNAISETKQSAAAANARRQLAATVRNLKK